jgi:hypothetical protein
MVSEAAQKVCPRSMQKMKTVEFIRSCDLLNDGEPGSRA